MSLNYIIISGHLAQDGEIRYTVSGHPVLQFSLALPTSSDTTSTSNYIRVVSRKEYPQSTVRRLVKGTPILVEGYLFTKASSTTSRSGSSKKNVIIGLENLEILPVESN